MSIISGVRGVSLLILFLFASFGSLYWGLYFQGHAGLCCLHLQRQVKVTLALKMETKHQKKKSVCKCLEKNLEVTSPH